MKKKKNNFSDTFIKVQQFRVPLRIHIERRRNIRIAVGKDNVLLRIPIYASMELDKHIASAHDWLLKISYEMPDLLEKYNISKYKINNDICILGKDRYILEVIHGDKKGVGEIKLNGNVLIISLPEDLDEFDKRVMIRNLISKLLVKKYKRWVEERLKFWNETYFQKELKGLTLRYNSTNWGSCSTNNRINISTRSLLLPIEIFDYILVHELSHLVEMNHSSKFWEVVKSVMPDYEKSEKWLKQHSTSLDY